MSQALFCTEGLITLVRAYAVQDTQCVMRSSEDGYWALARELERIGDEIRVYVDGLVQHGYAEGRKDEAEEHALRHIETAAESLAASELMPVERIAMLWNSLPLETDAESVVAFARAIERFHGITRGRIASGINN